MARYRGPVCKLCRREGLKLFLKGERCFKPSCAIEKRNYAPGQHGNRRTKVQAYGIQLREKQKTKRIYGVLERQFRRHFAEGERRKGITGENLLAILESRLDNVSYRLGFAGSRAQARQLVAHGHVMVNGSRVDAPSFQVKPGMVISLRESSRKNALIQSALEQARSRGVPRWLSLEAENFRGTVVSAPGREDITLPIQEQLIVELYSK
ncbi:MAG TPA: 30S ribosomal protein S4 [Candidatus Polarisedimenticolia bacterium]|nr:30S ribosomal protein S4 [Candidatus Polarisedimenticolia bacterium]